MTLRPFPRRAGGLILLSVIVFVSCVAPFHVYSAEWTPPEIRLSSPLRHPAIACTANELERLRAAWKSENKAENAVVAETVHNADRALEQPVEFPPRGGQHNQWYQCEKCQLGLRTLDSTHHQCPKCKTVYTGEPYDDVIFSRVHGRNLSGMNAAAWAWAITQDGKYAQFAARVLLGYAQRYRDYPYHTANRSPNPVRTGGHIAEQTLNEAGMMGGQIAPAYDLIHDSGVLSAADHEAIRSGLLLPMLQSIDQNKAGKSNWQSYHNAAMLMGGALLGDGQWVRKAISDPRTGSSIKWKHR